MTPVLPLAYLPRLTVDAFGQPAWAYLLNHMAIVDPDTSECGRFEVANPLKEYGLSPREAALLRKMNRCEQASRLPAYAVAAILDAATMKACREHSDYLTELDENPSPYGPLSLVDSAACRHIFNTLPGII